MSLSAKVCPSLGVSSLDRRSRHSMCVPAVRVPCIGAALFARCTLAASDAAIAGLKAIVRQAATPQDSDLSGCLAVPFVSVECSQERVDSTIRRTVVDLYRSPSRHRPDSRARMGMPQRARMGNLKLPRVGNFGVPRSFRGRAQCTPGCTAPTASCPAAPAP